MRCLIAQAVIAGPKVITPLHTAQQMTQLNGVNGCNGCWVNNAAYEGYLEAAEAAGNWAGNQAARGQHIFSVTGALAARF